MKKIFVFFFSFFFGIMFTNALSLSIYKNGEHIQMTHSLQVGEEVIFEIEEYLEKPISVFTIQDALPLELEFIDIKLISEQNRKATSVIQYDSQKNLLFCTFSNLDSGNYIFQIITKVKKENPKEFYNQAAILKDNDTVMTNQVKMSVEKTNVEMGIFSFYEISLLISFLALFSFFSLKKKNLFPMF